MKIVFTKIEGAGNDFILINNIKGNVPYLSKRIRSHLCDRKRGIGADGILLLENDDDFPFMMRYYNADGGEAELCGNGARCAALYAFLNGIAPQRFSFRSKSGLHKAEILKGNTVRVELPVCKFKRKVTIKISDDKFVGFFLTVGVPHLVIFLKKTLQKINVLHIGKKIRNLKRFYPEGTNVNFVKIEGRNKLHVRTYERGVEGETLSCGTGAAAASAIAYLQKMVTSPVYVKPLSKETIKVILKDIDGKIIPYIQAKVHLVFSGTIDV